nr:ribosomal protein L33 [Lysimachia heterogenea]
MAKGKDVRVRVILECTGCQLIRYRRGFPDILLKKIDTIRLIDWN